MTRVSENSATASFKFALNKTKEKLENLQMKGTTLKAITRPSDAPIDNIEGLTLKAMKKDNDQYLRNSNFALMQLNTTEKSIEELTEILTKAKEIAIAQSSDFYHADIRKNVANEVKQLRNMALSIGNQRLGNRYLFGGYKTLQAPFNETGQYLGDQGHTTLEISKDFYIPINLNGHEVFFSDDKILQANKIVHPLAQFSEFKNSVSSDQLQTNNTDEGEGRSIASNSDEKTFHQRSNLLSQLDQLVVGLETNDTDTIQQLLPEFDSSISRLITLRTRVGSIVTSLETTKNSLEAANLNAEERKSQLIDADLAELFSDITKQEAILKTTYQAGKASMNQTLLDFLRR